ncbi:hypothetical protein [Streptomyces phaeochromogenes]|uniref:hypothetical protein n=1 Tax=Streptomyces phaeochromogenes TaxID=1923 RepID=UPI002DDBF783|nr:hypothetical protein [Streptomyces phaeochromogenes]WRZ29982.1 hypothetical protein OG931_20630 [Streptomyces phaeochromogenes]
MTTAKPTQRRARPIAGTRPTVRLDDQFARDLAVLMQTGDDLTTAMRTAVGIVADMYRTAWHHQSVPVGTAPTLKAYKFVEAPPVPGPPSLPRVTHNGPMWTPSSRQTSTDDARRQQPPHRQQTGRPPVRP